MRNKLIDQHGAYKENGFTGVNGAWVIIQSESTSDARGSVMQTLDTFKSEKGEYKTMKRSQVDELFELGKIWLTKKN